MIGANIALRDYEFRCCNCEFPVKIYEHPIIKEVNSRQIFFVPLCDECIKKFNDKCFDEGYDKGRIDMIDENIETENSLHEEYVKELKAEHEENIKELQDRLADYSNVIKMLLGNGHKKIVEEMCEKYCVPCYS